MWTSCLLILQPLHISGVMEPGFFQLECTDQTSLISEYSTVLCFFPQKVIWAYEAEVYVWTTWGILLCPVLDFAAHCRVSGFVFVYELEAGTRSRSPIQSCHLVAVRLCLQGNCQSCRCQSEKKPGKKQDKSKHLLQHLQTERSKFILLRLKTPHVSVDTVDSRFCSRFFCVYSVNWSIYSYDIWFYKNVVNNWISIIFGGL